MKILLLALLALVAEGQSFTWVIQNVYEAPNTCETARLVPDACIASNKGLFLTLSAPSKGVPEDLIARNSWRHDVCVKFDATRWNKRTCNDTDIASIMYSDAGCTQEISRQSFPANRCGAAQAGQGSGSALSGVFFACETLDSPPMLSNKRNDVFNDLQYMQGSTACDPADLYGVLSFPGNGQCVLGEKRTCMCTGGSCTGYSLAAPCTGVPGATSPTGVCHDLGSDSFVRKVECVAASNRVPVPTCSADSQCPPGFSYRRISAFTGGTFVTVHPGGDPVVLDQRGQAYRLVGDEFVQYVDLRGFTQARGERGLLGVAFDPDFGSNSFVYFFLTRDSTPGLNVVWRYTEVGGTVDLSTRVQIWVSEALINSIHNGGSVAFGPDGKLYIGHGDGGGSFGRDNAQSLANTFGKILRINPDGSIPADNPFAGSLTGSPEAIWSLGLRNPFVIDFPRGSTDAIIHDVGETTWEEINIVSTLTSAPDSSRGVPLQPRIESFNFGWPNSEGRPGCSVSNTNRPVPVCPYYVYDHEENRCSITGGASYQGGMFPSQYHGGHFFTDFCAGWIRFIKVNATTPLGAQTEDFIQWETEFSSFPVSLTVGRNGELYVLTRGELGVIEYSAPPDECQSADINGDGMVNLSDIAEVISAWGPCPETGPCRTDLWKCDGVTNLFEILMIIDQWGPVPQK